LLPLFRLYPFHQNGEETQKIRNRVYGKNNRPVDLRKESIINIRKEERVKESKNVLIGMYAGGAAVANGDRREEAEADTKIWKGNHRGAGREAGNDV